MPFQTYGSCEEQIMMVVLDVVVLLIDKFIFTTLSHPMEETYWWVYVPAAIAQDIIAISKSFNVDAQIVGRVEASDKNKLTIKSEYGTFEY